MSTSDPVFVAIEHHRLADAAYDAALDRQIDESLTAAPEDQEHAALIALLRTKPETLDARGPCGRAGACDGC